MPALPSAAATKRTFSLLTRLRSTLRATEAHPFERYPAHGSIAKADWGKQVRHVGETAVVYIPAIGLFLGWPLLAEKLCDGRM